MSNNALIIKCEVVTQELLENMVRDLKIDIFSNKRELFMKNYSDFINITGNVILKRLDLQFQDGNKIIFKACNEIILLGQISIKNKINFNGILKFKRRIPVIVYIIKENQVKIEPKLLSILIKDNQILIKNLKNK